MFDSSSRYAGQEIQYRSEGGKTVAYISRRFVPPPPSGSPLIEHTVLQGERLDQITARYLGEPELFWQLCDANRAMCPDELTETIERKIKITLLQG
jgi:hypothetical protein